MNEIRNLPNYKSILKSIPSAMDSFFVCANIGDESEAAVSLYRQELEELYPALRCLEYELKFSYGIKNDMPVEEDKAMSSYILSEELYQKAGKAEEFSEVYAPLDFSEPEIINFLEGLDQTAEKINKPAEQAEYAGWLKILTRICNLNLDIARKNKLEDLYEDLRETQVAEVIAEKICMEKADDTDIFNINSAIMSSCAIYANAGKNVSGNILAASIINNIKDDPNFDLRKIHQVVNNCAAPLEETLNEKIEDFQTLNKTQKKLYRIHKNADTRGLDIEGLRQAIFREKLSESLSLKQEKEVPAQMMNITGFTAEKALNMDAFIANAQEIYNEEFAYTGAKDQIWKEYETDNKVSSDEAIRHDLVNFATATLVNMCREHDSSEEYFEDSILNNHLLDIQVLQSMGDDVELDDDDIGNILSFCDKVVSIDDTLKTYKGIQISNNLITPDIMAKIVENGVNSPYDLEIINAYLSSVSSGYEQHKDQLMKMADDQADDNILGKIKDYPDSLEKFRASKCFYDCYTFLSDQLFEHDIALGEITVEKFRDEHRPVYENLAKSIDVMAEYYPDVNKYGSEKLASDIDYGFTQTQLNPIYKNFLVLRDDDNIDEMPKKKESNEKITAAYLIERYSDFEPESEESLSSLINTIDKFGCDVLAFHINRIKNTQYSIDAMKALLEQTNLEDYADACQYRAMLMATVLEEQVPAYNKYKQYKQRKSNEISGSEMAQQILIQNRRFYN